MFYLEIFLSLNDWKSELSLQNKIKKLNILENIFFFNYNVILHFQKKILKSAKKKIEKISRESKKKQTAFF